jgi:3-oxoacyl-[acyl-carrier-protein] synthase-3
MSPNRRSVFIATGSYIPTKKVPNSDFLDSEFFLDYGQPLDPSDNPKTVSKFQAITGIEERRWVTDDLMSADVGYEAAKDALESGDIDGESLDYIIVAQNVGDIRADNPRSDLCPALSARIKQKLGIANPQCVAYDLQCGCPGWVQGVIQADFYLRFGDAARALVVGTETLSRISDPHDRDGMLYSDGAGAAILEARITDEPVGILSHAARTDALEHADLMWLASSYHPEYKDDRLFLKMNGRKLYEYALSTVPGVVRTSLEKANLQLGDVDKVLIHQANAKMDDAIMKRLFKMYGEPQVPEGLVPMTISWLGNSSVATVPTLLDLVVKGQLDGHGFSSGDVVVLVSVGAGMNISSVVYRWP